jgi:hypothetical protein
MAAPEIRAIDQEAANASGAHFSTGDLLAGEHGHAPFKRGGAARTIPLQIGVRAPPAYMIKLTESQEITPYRWVHPEEEM